MVLTFIGLFGERLELFGVRDASTVGKSQNESIRPDGIVKLGCCTVIKCRRNCVALPCLTGLLLARMHGKLGEALDWFSRVFSGGRLPLVRLLVEAFRRNGSMPRDRLSIGGPPNAGGGLFF